MPRCFGGFQYAVSPGVTGLMPQGAAEDEHLAGCHVLHDVLSGDAGGGQIVGLHQAENLLVVDSRVHRHHRNAGGLGLRQGFTEGAVVGGPDDDAVHPLDDRVVHGALLFRRGGFRRGEIHEFHPQLLGTLTGHRPQAVPESVGCGEAHIGYVDLVVLAVVGTAGGESKSGYGQRENENEKAAENLHIFLLLWLCFRVTASRRTAVRRSVFHTLALRRRWKVSSHTARIITNPIEIRCHDEPTPR